ncbi:hypothetical protein AXK58_03735 [Tsukamurella tyrosinosolvens]|nr:hypothetical protein AXK58_03735 [Tsukamurella tyrosinosolvens]
MKLLMRFEFSTSRSFRELSVARYWAETPPRTRPWKLSTVVESHFPTGVPCPRNNSAEVAPTIPSVPPAASAAARGRVRSVPPNTTQTARVTASPMIVLRLNDIRMMNNVGGIAQRKNRRPGSFRRKHAAPTQRTAVAAIWTFVMYRMPDSAAFSFARSSARPSRTRPVTEAMAIMAAEPHSTGTHTLASFDTRPARTTTRP